MCVALGMIGKRCASGRLECTALLSRYAASGVEMCKMKIIYVDFKKWYLFQNVLVRPEVDSS